MVKTKPIQINIPIPILIKIDKAIEEKGVAANKSEFIRFAINEKLDRLFLHK